MTSSASVRGLAVATFHGATTSSIGVERSSAYRWTLKLNVTGTHLSR